MHRIHNILIALAALAASHAATAQIPDSLTPHRGTWAVEAAPFASSASILRFSSPTSAWLLGAFANFTHSERPGTGPVSAFSSNSASTSALLGHRWYSRSGADPHLRTLYGLGLTGSYGRTTVTDSKQTQWAAGGYGELGAVWFFTPHVSLGGVGMLQAQWGESTTDPVAFSAAQGDFAGRQTLGTFGVSATIVRLTAAVYF